MEPPARGGLGPEHAVAPLDDVEVDLEDARLGQVIFEREGDQDLAQLADEAAPRRQVQVLGQLLGDRAAADRHRALVPVGRDRVLERMQVDAVVAVEAFVLGVDHRGAQVARDRRQRPPLPLERERLAGGLGVRAPQVDERRRGRVLDGEPRGVGDRAPQPQRAHRDREGGDLDEATGGAEPAVPGAW